jgi:hypothetical protein
MVNHLELGETPEFVLMTTGSGLPQPASVLVTRRVFWISLGILDAFAAGLGTVIYRLNRREIL